MGLKQLKGQDLWSWNQSSASLRWKQVVDKGTMFGKTLATFLVSLMLAIPSMAVELFRYRGAARDGGTLEYIFETDEENLPQTVSKEKVAEIAAEFMTSFYHIQIGARETQEFRTTPDPFWLVSFSEASQGPAKQMYFVVVLPNGTIVEPSVVRQL